MVFYEHSELAHASRVQQVALEECSALEVLGSQHFTLDLIRILVLLFVVFFFEGVLGWLHEQVVLCGREITFNHSLSHIFVCQFDLLPLLQCERRFGQNVKLVMRKFDVVKKPDDSRNFSRALFSELVDEKLSYELNLLHA